MDIESVLAPGERVLWDGRPSGYPRRPPRRWWIAYLIAIVGLVLVGACIEIEGSRPDSWLRHWVMPGRAHPKASVARQVLTVGVVVRTVRNPAGTTADTVRFVPHPLFLCGVLLVAVELWRFARYRSTTYGITNQRAFVFGRKGIVQGVPLAEITHATTNPRDLVINAATSTVRFDGIDDPEAALSALNAAQSGNVPAAQA